MCAAKADCANYVAAYRKGKAMSGSVDETECAIASFAVAESVIFNHGRHLHVRSARQRDAVLLAVQQILCWIEDDSPSNCICIFLATVKLRSTPPHVLKSHSCSGWLWNFQVRFGPAMTFR